jgi:hypothetical protein
MSNSSLARTSVFGLVFVVIALAFVVKLGGRTDGTVCVMFMSNDCGKKIGGSPDSGVEPEGSKKTEVNSDLDYDPKLRIVK